MKPTLLVMAAGMGSRYGGLKQIDSMGPTGETILDYSVFDAIRAGFGNVVFIIRPDFEKDFREKPWGTTHAILCARDVVKTPFAVINADDFYGRDSYAVLGKKLSTTANTETHYNMVGFTLKNTLSDHGTVARGVCRQNDKGYLTDIQELLKIAKTESGAQNIADDGTVTKLTGDEPVSMNMWGFTPSIFPQLETLFKKFLTEKGQELKSECYIPLSLGEIVKNGDGDCAVLRTTSSWFGVTYREDKPIVQASIQKLVNEGSYPSNLWA